jgi:hypothetical protein
VTAQLRPGDLVAFLGPSLSPSQARRVAPCRVLPPARAGDVLAVLPERPLAIALVDGLFDSTPSVWHREILAALDAGVAVFGGGSMGALRAAELTRHGVVGVGWVFQGYRDGALVDDAEVALLHADAAHGFRPFTLPLVQVRAAAEAARTAGALSPARARALVGAAAGLHYTRRTWPAVLDAAGLRGAGSARLASMLASAPDVKAADARACLAAAAEFALARRRGAPPPPRPAAGPAPSHLRRARLARARTVLPGGRAFPSGEVVDRLARRPDAGRLAADGLRRALTAALARSMGIAVSPAEIESAEHAWLGRLGVAARGRAAFLAACGLDDGAARALAEDLALEARLLAMAERAVPDGPAWAEGLALEARLTGAWVEEAERSVPRTAPRSPPVVKARARARPAAAGRRVRRRGR